MALVCLRIGPGYKSRFMHFKRLARQYFLKACMVNMHNAMIFLLNMVEFFSNYLVDSD